MSFILDALKKSEARRRMGETPGLESAAPSMTGPPRRRSPVMLIMSVLLLVLLALLLWREFGSGLMQRLTGGGGAQPEAPAVVSEPGTPRPERADERVVTRGLADRRGVDRPPEPAATDSGTGVPARPDNDADRPVADEPRVRLESESVERPSEPAGETRESAAAAEDTIDPTPAGTGRESRTERESPPRATRPEERAEGDVEPVVEEPPAEPRPADPGPEQPFQPERPAWMERWELPPDVRRDMPELDLTVHVFAGEPAERFVLINTERYGEGDSVAEGVRLVEIIREGAVLEYSDYRFLLRQ